MCTNYTTTVCDEIRDRLNLNPPTFEYEPELWPGYKGPMLIRDFEWRLAMFGMVPYFSKDGKDFRRTYNARSETADEKPTYRGPWRRRRYALIPMAAFFEPNYESGKPVRWRIRPPSFVNLSAIPRMVEGHLLSDVIAINASIDIVMGEIDR